MSKQPKPIYVRTRCSQDFKEQVLDYVRWYNSKNRVKLDESKVVHIAVEEYLERNPAPKRSSYGLPAGLKKSVGAASARMSKSGNTDDER